MEQVSRISTRTASAESLIDSIKNSSSPINHVDRVLRFSCIRERVGGSNEHPCSRGSSHLQNVLGRSPERVPVSIHERVEVGAGVASERTFAEMGDRSALWTGLSDLTHDIPLSSRNI